MLPQSRLRLLLAATLISTTVAQSDLDLPSQISAASDPRPTSGPSFPPCATSCLSTATNALTCQENDSRCQCSRQDQVRSSVEQCLTASEACSASEAAQAASYYRDVCLALGLDENGEPLLLNTSGGAAIATDNGLVVSASNGPSSPSATPTSASPSGTSGAQQGRENQANDDDDDDGLSVATVAGIAAGCAFVAVAIITGLIWMYVKRRDGDEEIVREIESQAKKPKPGFESSSTTFKSIAKSDEKSTEYALSEIPAKANATRRKPSIAERRNRNPGPLHRSPSEALNKSTYPFPFGDKRGAEASLTNLTLPGSAGKQVSSSIVVQSPARSQFSDQASIYSVSSIHSEEAHVERASEARRSRPTTFYNMYSNGQEGVSSVNLVEPSMPTRGPGSLQKNKANLQIKAPSAKLQVPAAHVSPNPFDSSANGRTQATNPFATPSSEERKNPFNDPKEPRDGGQSQTSNRSDILSGGSFGKFDFEMSDDNNRDANGSRTLRDSFFNSLDLGFGSSTSNAR
jgi:hypothetical protein